jgi:putative colanic acid biosysnthesis UDP-glucose lipid carrier transferase
MKNSYKYTFIIFCAIADMIAMVVGNLLFFDIAIEEGTIWNTLSLNKMIIITVVSWFFAGMHFKLYAVDALFSLEKFYSKSWRALLTQLVLWYFCVFVLQDNLLYFLGSNANLLQVSFLMGYFLFSRILFTLLLEKIKKLVVNTNRVAIWGFNKTSIELASQLETNSYFTDFRGILNENAASHYASNEDFALALADGIYNASEQHINELYIVANPDFITDLNYFFGLGDKYCMCLRFIPDFSMISKNQFSSSHLNNFHVIKPRFEPLQNSYNRLIKRVFDVFFSSLVIIFVLSWLYPIIAIIIKKQSKGPVLFKQLRSGLNNEPFWCYKFRSMYINMGDESQQAQKGDARITPIGQFLRCSSLDEMPQFFNVLLGNMSIVGPRPHMIKHTLDYNAQIDNFMVRHFVKPGITGLAQVSGLRGETKRISDMIRRVNKDIEYVQRWSLFTDIKICFMTVIVTLKGDVNAF